VNLKVLNAGFDYTFWVGNLEKCVKTNAGFGFPFLFQNITANRRSTVFTSDKEKQEEDVSNVGWR
jgi:hypothetical protein